MGDFVKFYWPSQNAWTLLCQQCGVSKQNIFFYSTASKLWSQLRNFHVTQFMVIFNIASAIALIQGVPTRYDILWSPRWPTKADFQVQKKVAAHSVDWDIWVLSIYFPKSNIGWPQQPPTAKVTIFNLIFYDSINISFIWNMKIRCNFSLNY